MTQAEADARYKQRCIERDPEAWAARRRAVYEKYRSRADFTERRQSAQKKFRRNNPEKVAAWNAVQRALQSGQLVRPDNCQECGSDIDVQASHDDYAQQLSVEWLCRKCHNAKDTQLRRTK